MQLDVFAVDVGATRTKFGVVRAADRAVWLDAVPTPVGGPSAHAEHIRALHLDHAPGLPLVVAWPGPSNTGCTLDEIREALDRSGPRARAIVGDMIAAVIGEAGDDDIVLLQIGSGVGGAMVSTGRVTACVTGHLVFREDGIPCRTGMRGTVQAYLGWHSLRRRAGSLEPAVELNGPLSLLALSATHAGARMVFEDALQAAGFAASVLVACSQAPTLVLAGGVAAAWGELLVDAVRVGIDRRVDASRAAAVDVRLSELREVAPLLGLWKLASGRTAA